MDIPREICGENDENKLLSIVPDFSQSNLNPDIVRQQRLLDYLLPDDYNNDMQKKLKKKLEKCENLFEKLSITTDDKRKCKKYRRKKKHKRKKEKKHKKSCKNENMRCTYSVKMKKKSGKGATALFLESLGITNGNRTKNNKSSTVEDKELFDEGYLSPVYSKKKTEKGSRRKRTHNENKCDFHRVRSKICRHKEKMDYSKTLLQDLKKLTIMS